MFITINNRRLNYEIINSQLLNTEKPVLVFLHEGLGSIRQWLDFPKKLCDKLNLSGLIYDRYGYGLSDPLENPRTLNFMHDEALIFLPELIEKLKIKNKLILIGHSDGASIALIYASEHSDCLLGVISEAAHVVIEDISRNGIQKIQNEYKKSKALKKLFSIYHGENAESMFMDWTSTLLSVEFKKWNIEKILQTIQVPVLVIQGDDDEYGSYDQLVSIKKNISSSVEIMYIKGCKHIPHLQAQSLVIAKMEKFISLLIVNQQ